MERLRGEPENKEYGYEQLEFIRILIEKEGCSSHILHLVTGIPMGSMNALIKKGHISPSGTFPDKTPMRNKLASINRARRVAILREKYKDEISRLFGKKNDLNTLD